MQMSSITPRSAASALAIEESAAELLMTLSEIPDEIWSLSPVLLRSVDLRVVSGRTVAFVLGAKANAESSLVIFPLTPDGYFHGISPEARETVLRNCLRAAITARRPGRFLPRSWAPYHEGAFTIFYPTTIAMGNAGVSARSIIQTSPAGTPHVLVSSFLPDGQFVDLRHYEVPKHAENALFDANDQLEGVITVIPPVEGGHEFGGITPYAAPSHGRTFSEWIPLLTPPQAEFLKADIAGPTKVRGAAGTGKTLALMLKSVHDLYRARDGGRPWRGLIVTHNWLTAEAIRSALTSIDERAVVAHDDTTQISVMTLQNLATSTLHLDTPDAYPISEDGHEGKLMQLETIESLVHDFQDADWSVYRSQCSPTFRARIEAPRGTPDFRLFAWDLMNEFACVISATRNTSRESYMTQERHKWMMALPRPADREVVFLLHERFRAFMHDELKVLTTYDVINDLLRWLDTNSWHLKRRSEGYDAIFVDEAHLFNKQEMLVFQYLSRDANRPPHAVLALDPRQSPTESFLGFKADQRHSVARMFDTQTLVRDIKFDEVFRYTAQINSLLDILEQCWFGFELDDEYGALPRRTSTAGPVPRLIRVADMSRSLDEAARQARELIQEGGNTAVLCLSSSVLEQFARRIRLLQRERECRIVDSREHSNALVAPGKRYFVSQPEYVAGSQFDSVIIVDANDSQVRAGADEQLQQRRLLSLLYLAISRAKRVVVAISADADGGPIRFLRPAIASNLLEVSSR